jgi:hypothetical protein
MDCFENALALSLKVPDFTIKPGTFFNQELTLLFDRRIKLSVLLLPLAFLDYAMKNTTY